MLIYTQGVDLSRGSETAGTSIGGKRNASSLACIGGHGNLNRVERGSQNGAQNSGGR